MRIMNIDGADFGTVASYGTTMSGVREQLKQIRANQEHWENVAARSNKRAAISYKTALFTITFAALWLIVYSAFVLRTPSSPVGVDAASGFDALPETGQAIIILIAGVVAFLIGRALAPQNKRRIAGTGDSTTQDDAARQKKAKGEIRTMLLKGLAVVFVLGVIMTLLTLQFVKGIIETPPLGKMLSTSTPTPQTDTKDSGSSGEAFGTRENRK